MEDFHVTVFLLYDLVESGIGLLINLLHVLIMGVL